MPLYRRGGLRQKYFLLESEKFIKIGPDVEHKGPVGHWEYECSPRAGFELLKEPKVVYYHGV